MSASAPTAPVVPHAVDAAGIAGRFSVSLRTVRTWDSSGKMPRGVRVGGRKLWSLPELESWFAAGCPSRAEWEARKIAAPKK